MTILIVCLCMATLTGVLPCFFLSCKANARVKPARTEHGPHSSQFLCCVYCLFCVVLCIVCVFMCTVLLPPGGNPIAVKYIVSYKFDVGYLLFLQLGSCVVEVTFTVVRFTLSPSCLRVSGQQNGGSVILIVRYCFCVPLHVGGSVGLLSCDNTGTSVC